MNEPAKNVPAPSLSATKEGVKGSSGPAKAEPTTVPVPITTQQIDRPEGGMLPVTALQGPGDPRGSTPPPVPLLEALAKELDPTSDQFDNAFVRHPQKSDLKIPIRHEMVSAYLVAKYYEKVGGLPSVGQKEMFLTYLEGKAWANRAEVDAAEWADSQLEQEPLVSAIVALLENSKGFEGTREELKAEFKELQNSQKLTKVAFDSLPETVQKLSTTLSKIAPALGHIGIAVERVRNASERKIKIYRKSGTLK